MDKQIGTSDIFSKSFLSLQSGMERFTPVDILTNLTVTLIVALFIYYIYKKTFQGVLYQKSFAISLVAISMIVTLIIMTISGNLVLSLGMVGALSIVRFRTPIKDPVDLVFIFWAISIGIANGVGYFSLSFIGSLFITIILLVMTYKKSSTQSYLLILDLNKNSNINTIENIIKDTTNNYQLKSKVVTQDNFEIIYEIRADNDKLNSLNRLKDNKDISKFVLISYNGDLSNV